MQEFLQGALSPSPYSPAIHEVDLLGEWTEGFTKETQSRPQCQPQLLDALLIINRQKDRPIGWLAPHSEQHRKVLRKMPVCVGRGKGGS